MSNDHESPKLIPGAKIDWTCVPEIKADLDVNVQNRGLLETQENDQPITDHPNTSDWFRADVGKQLTLHVTVTDTALAQVTLMAAFGPNSRVPGLDITRVDVNPEGQALIDRAQMLRDMADELEQRAQTTHNAFQ